MRKYHSDFVSGGWVQSSGEERTVLINPTTEQVIGEVVHSTREDVSRAVAAAASALRGWSSVPYQQRATLLERAMAHVAAKSDHFVIGMAQEVGIPVWFGRLKQLSMPIQNAAVSIECVRRMSWSESVGTSLVTKVPMGVIAAITPWNAPLHQMVAKAVPALLAGCTMVMKPSENSPSAAVLFASALMDAGLPPGVFNLVWGGATVGSALCEHPLVDMVSFTGSDRGGRAVAELSGRHAKRVVLELGGKSAAILLDDADLNKAVPAIVTSCFANSGQVCSAQSRLIAPRHLLRTVEQLCLHALECWVVGDPLDENTRLGPQATAHQRDRVREFIKIASGQGARILAGGADQPAGMNRGYFVKPTIFSDVEPNMVIAQEEIFGPVLSIIPAESIQHAVHIANGTQFGLSGSVWGGKTDATNVATQLMTGQVSINGAPQNYMTPFGGFKRSGFGRENGIAGIEEFLQLRAIHGAA